MKLDVSLRELIEHENANPFTGTLLALDPGETTGYTVFNGDELVGVGQLATKDIDKGVIELIKILDKFKPSFVVYEAYRVYKWKTKDHANSDLHTSQFIGVIRAICAMRSIPYHMQMAQVAKQFCTDDKLKEWGLWIKGQRHARDAIRHAIYFITFNWSKFEGEKDD